MQRANIFPYLIALALSSALMTAPTHTAAAPASSPQTQQVAPRKYILKPLNLGVNTEIRARSTRSLQIRVTDENDRPIPDAPVLFLLSGGDAGSSGLGSFAGQASVAGQTSVRAMTNAQGIAQVDYTAGEMVGSKAQIKAQVEGTEAAWEGALVISSALSGAPSQKAVPFISGLASGQLPKSSVARHTFVTTEGRRFTLETLRGKVVVLLFFGPWCNSSRRQVEMIRTLLTSYKSEELEVIGLSVKDSRSTPQSFLQFIAAQQIDYSVVPDVEDKHFVKFVNSTDVSVPQTLIYGRDGRLSAHFLGYNPQVGAALEQKVKEELTRK